MDFAVESVGFLKLLLDFFWTAALPVLIAALLLFTFIAAGKQKHAVETERGFVLRYSKTLEVILVGLLVVYLGLIIGGLLTGYFKNEDDIKMACGLLGILAVGILWAYFYMVRYEIVLTAEGIERRGFLSRKTNVEWKEIVDIRFSKAFNMYIIISNSGHHIRVSRDLNGLNTFFDELKKHAAQDSPNLETILKRLPTLED